MKARPMNDLTKEQAYRRWKKGEDQHALIQSFPKNMEFSGKISSQYTQIGDAVPPLLAKALGSALIEQLNGEVIDEENYTTSEFGLPLFERIK